MSNDELHISVERRCLDAICRFERRHCAPLRRELSGPGVIARRALAVPQRLFVRPVHILGHAFSPAYALLMTGPAAVPALTTCVITWTVSMAAYHRVRYKLYGAPSWTTSAWSVSATTNASVTLTGLTAERTRYQYEIQSDLDKTGKTQGWWDNAGAPFEFYTTCAGVINYSGFKMTIDAGWAVWEWDTNVKTAGRSRWKIYPTGNYGDWSSYTPSYSLHTYRDSMPPLTPSTSKMYSIQIQSKDKCGNEGTVGNYLIIYFGGVWNVYLYLP